MARKAPRPAEGGEPPYTFSRDGQDYLRVRQGPETTDFELGPTGSVGVNLEQHRLTLEIGRTAGREYLNIRLVQVSAAAGQLL